MLVIFGDFLRILHDSTMVIHHFAPPFEIIFSELFPGIEQAIQRLSLKLLNLESFKTITGPNKALFIGGGGIGGGYLRFP